MQDPTQRPLTARTRAIHHQSQIPHWKTWTRATWNWLPESPSNNTTCPVGTEMSIPMNLLEYTQETNIQETCRDRMPRWQNDLMLGAARQWWTRQMTPNMQQVTIHDRIKREDMAWRLDLLATTQSSDLLTIDIILRLPGTHFSLNFHSIWISLTHSHYFVRSEIGSTRHLTINCTDPGTHFSLNLHIIWTGSTNSHYSAHREIRSTSSLRYRNHTMTIYKGCFPFPEIQNLRVLDRGSHFIVPFPFQGQQAFQLIIKACALNRVDIARNPFKTPQRTLQCYRGAVDGLAPTTGD